MATVLINATPSSADPSLDPDEQAFLTLINNYRSQNGLSTLVLQDDLNQAADWFATDMTTKNYYGGDAYCASLNPPKPAHCDSLGRGPGQRLVAFGYPTGQYISENIAAGFRTAQDVFDAWKASPGHNSNMRGGWVAIGIGKSCSSTAYYGCYWVTDFGTYAGPDHPNPSQTAIPPTQRPTPTATLVPTEPPTPTASESPTPQPTPTPTATPVLTEPPTPTASESPTPQPTPTPANLIWDDIDCNGSINAEDAIAVLRGGAGFSKQSEGCPSLWDLVVVNGSYRLWGDTDCSLGVGVDDSIKLLAYLAKVNFNVKAGCPAPGTPF